MCSIDATFQDLSDAQWMKIKREKTAVNLSDGHLNLQDNWRALGDLMHLRKDHRTKYKVRIFGIGKDGLWAMICGSFHAGGDLFSYVVFPYVESTDNS